VHSHRFFAENVFTGCCGSFNDRQVCLVAGRDLDEINFRSFLKKLRSTPASCRKFRTAEFQGEIFDFSD
jgi:hypothetical protein